MISDRSIGGKVMNRGIVILLVLAAIAAVGIGYYVMNDGDIGETKNTGGVTVTVSNMSIGSIPVKVYIDGDLRQDTTVGPMSFTSADKKVSWKGGDTHSVTVKVTYKSGGQDKVKEQNVLLTNGRNQMVQITL